MRQLLKLQHHTHTGKLLPHHHTSYRALLVIFLVFGSILIGVTESALADTLVVNGKVPAVIPSQPAETTNQTTGSTSSEQEITVQGTCEYAVPNNIVAIYSGTTLYGSTACSIGGTFAVSIMLRRGVNTFVIRTMNITDDFGPDSTPLVITYTAPTPNPTAPTSPSGPSNNAQPTPGSSVDEGAAPSIASTNAFIVYGPGKEAVWTGSFQEGSAPYEVVIDWGDGTRDRFRDVKSGQRSFDHKYAKNETYFVTVTVTDSAGVSRSQHLVAVTPYVAAPLIGGTTTSTTFGANQSIIFGIYGAYLLLIALVGTAWYDTRIRPIWKRKTWQTVRVHSSPARHYHQRTRHHR